MKSIYTTLFVAIAFMAFSQDYMDKIAVGPGFADGIVDLDKSVDENITTVSKAYGANIVKYLIL